MHTLKKVLALALVVAFAFTLTAGATVFTDNAKITQQDQVNLTYALGIIKGYPDGSFGADKTITRAEAAKMLYVIKTGKDQGSANYVNAANPFTDVPSSHWAKGYINYCFLNGIIAGVGGGMFDPEGAVTGAQLAKMLLTVIGYDATKAGLTGSQWLISTMSLAFENQLFDNYAADVNSPAPRGDAAVLFYNTVFTPTVTYRDGTYVNYNSDNNDLPTVGAKNFSLLQYKGTLKAADEFAMDGASIAEDTIRIVANANSADSGFTNFGAIGTNKSFDYKGARDLVGLEVKVVYDSKNNTVYNVVPTKDAKVYTTTLSAINKTTMAAPVTKIVFGGTNYLLDAAVALYQNYNTTAVATGIAAALTTLDVNKGDAVRLIDTDDDGDIDLGFITARTFGYVDSMDSTSIDFGEGGKKFLNDDGTKFVYAEGIAEGDYVFYWKDLATSDGAYTVTKATSIEATVDGTAWDSRVADYKGLFYSGATHNLSAIPVAANLDEASQDVPNIGDKYTIFTDASYWVAVIAGAGSVANSGDYAYVMDSAAESMTTAAVVKVLIPGEDDPVRYNLNKDSKAYVGTTLTTVTLDNAASVANYKNKIFAYEIRNDGSIYLTEDLSGLTNGASLTYNKDSEIASTTGGTLIATNAAAPSGTYLLADDAVIFYLKAQDAGTNRDTAANWEIYNGSDFANTITANVTRFATKTSGGFDYIKVAVMASTGAAGLAAQSGSASDNMFGYVLGTAARNRDAATDTNYVQYSMWVNGATGTYKQMDTSTVASYNGTVLGRATFALFTLKADGTIKNIQSAYVSSSDTQAGARGDIVAYNKDSGKITIENGATSNIYNITSDTVTVYIDNNNAKGVTGSGYPKISAADATAFSNCFYVLGVDDDANNILYIAVDTSTTLGAAIR